MDEDTSNRGKNLAHVLNIKMLNFFLQNFQKILLGAFLIIFLIALGKSIDDGDIRYKGFVYRKKK